jgi:murein DD-endopeptidase MepM/ murein hydrolase activator NlpD
VVVKRRIGRLLGLALAAQVLTAPPPRAGAAPAYLAPALQTPAAQTPGGRPEQVPPAVPVADVLLADAASGQAGSSGPPPDPAALRLLHPLAEPPESIDPWGWRWSERRRAWRMHTGVDLAAAEGTAVLAARAGTVRLVESVGGYGLSVLLDHGQGLETLYAHLLDAAVRPGQRVEAGEVIARLGASGQATGPHLHFELRRRGARLIALDPTPHLPPLLPPPPAPAAVATMGP